jgi:hypothetical protein
MTYRRQTPTPRSIHPKPAGAPFAEIFVAQLHEVFHANWHDSARMIR